MRTFVLLLLLCPLFSFSEDNTGAMDNVRIMYAQASKNEEVAQKLYDFFKEEDEQAKPIFQGYAGASETIQASYQNNVFDKLKYFIAGRKKLERAIERAPENVELRYLRFTVQSNCPGFLNYSGEVKTDKAILVDALLNKKQESGNLHRYIAGFLLETTLLSETERTQISQLK